MCMNASGKTKRLSFSARSYATRNVDSHVSILTIVLTKFNRHVNFRSSLFLTPYDQTPWFGHHSLIFENGFNMWRWGRYENRWDLIWRTLSIIHRNSCDYILPFKLNRLFFGTSVSFFGSYLTTRYRLQMLFSVEFGLEGDYVLWTGKERWESDHYLKVYQSTIRVFF